MNGLCHSRYAMLVAAVACLAAGVATAETVRNVDLAQATTAGPTPDATITSCPPGATPVRVRPGSRNASPGAASRGTTGEDATALETTICVNTDADTGTSGYTGAPSPPAAPRSPDTGNETITPDARDRALR